MTIERRLLGLSKPVGDGTYPQIVEHGGTAGTARPTGAVRVFWRGTVAPTNAVQYDRWINTTSAPYTESIFNGSTWDLIGGASFEPTHTTTKRVTLQLCGDGNAVNTVSVDWVCRYLLSLPVTTTRWRLRVRNYNSLLETAYTGAVSFTGMNMGAPSYPSPGGVWQGAFGSAPASVFGAFATPSDGSEYVSAWVTDPALQFNAYQTHGLSLGATVAGGTSISKGTSGMTWASSSASGVSGQVGTAAAPTLATLSWGVSLCDTRIEYEAVTNLPVILALGDSITVGDSGETPQNLPGAWPHETWIGAAGMRNGFLWANTAVGGTQSSHWTTSSQWKWTRVDLATTVPDAAVYSIGSNDFNASVAATTTEANTLTTLGLIRALLGNKRIYLGTVIPRGFTAASAQENARTAYNAWVRQNPGGIHGVFDFDDALCTEADATLAKAKYMLNQPHPTQGGYLRMSQVLAGLR